ncbi:hypothetical protein B5G37_09680 [Pseudoflavonifractor sp. An85]|nr:hypothetical protein B5G37_09680 [Pseudoflavonifractor sp. An85]
MLLASDLCSVAYSETMVHEIEQVDRNAVIHINIGTKQLEYSYMDYQENTINISSEEGLKTLDRWYHKWTSLIRNIKDRGMSIQADLSGGFDSRLTFLLLHGSGVDLNNVLVNSIKDNLHTHVEDYKIASSISEHYGFSLNNRSVISGTPSYYTLDEIINDSFYIKLCFHKQMYWKLNYMSPNRACFGGSGGECVRSYWNKSKEQYIRECLNRCKKYPAEVSSQLEESLKRVLENSFESMQRKFERFGRGIDPQDLTLNFYRETRCRMHFGKDLVENYLGGFIKYTPLLDPELHKLKLNDENCQDKNLLMAVIFSRYDKDLLSFPFEGQRKIDESTIEYAQSISQKIPYVPSALTQDQGVNKLCNPSNRLPEESKPCPESRNQPLQSSEVSAYVESLFRSDSVQHLFGRMYDPKVYDYIVHEVKTKKYQPLENAYTVLGISKLIQDVAANRSLCSSIAEQLKKLPFEVVHQHDGGGDNEKKENEYELLKKPYFLNYVTARVDLQNVSSDSNRIELLDVSDKDAKASTPSWFRNNGVGVVLESCCGRLDIALKCVGDGTLNINLRGRDVRDKNGNRIPVYIDYRTMRVNGESVFDTVQPVTHDAPYCFHRKVKDGENVYVSLTWTHHEEKAQTNGLCKLVNKLFRK